VGSKPPELSRGKKAKPERAILHTAEPNRSERGRGEGRDKDMDGGVDEYQKFVK